MMMTEARGLLPENFAPLSVLVAVLPNAVGRLTPY